MENYNGRLACYDDKQGGCACFVPVCPKCGKFVKAGIVLMNIDGVVDLKKPNATCKRCGEVTMPFDGYYSNEDLGIKEGNEKWKTKN